MVLSTLLIASCSLWWVGSTVLSAYTLKFYNFNGSLPGYDKIGLRTQNIDPDKAAFSMAPHGEEAYAPVNADDHDHEPDDHDNGPYDADSYGRGPMFGGPTEYRPPGHSPSPAPPDNPFADDPYRAASSSSLHDRYAQQNPGAPAGGPRIYVPPQAEEYDGSEPVRFPAANYDRGLH